jgi:Zn finger protein HypA/HybF involved in hydrogenase expression
MPARDLPRWELMKLAQEALERYPEALVHFKYTCEHCGERCTLEEPNQLYEYGLCHKCGQETEIVQGGMTLVFTMGGEKP